MGLIKKIATLRKLYSTSPENARDLLVLRIESKIGISLHRLSRRRRLTAAFENRHTNPVDKRLQMFGNYYLAKDILPLDGIVFSAGVGQDTDFDEALLDYGAIRLFLIDPTPTSGVHVKAVGLEKRAVFEPIALADFDGEIELYIDDLEPSAETTTSISINRTSDDQSSITVACQRVITLMKRHGIDHLDVLKLDIEGAAIRVLADTFAAGIFPTQIAGEFERPLLSIDLPDYFAGLEALFTQLEGKGYEIFRTRPNAKGFQVEFVAVQFDASTKQ